MPDGCHPGQPPNTFRSKVDASSKISEYLSIERWKGFEPPPLPEK